LKYLFTSQIILTVHTKRFKPPNLTALAKPSKIVLARGEMLARWQWIRKWYHHTVN